MDTNYGKLTRIPNIPETGTLLKHGTERNLTLPLDLYNHYWSTTHTCVEQFSHHHACVPGSPVFTSLAELCTLHFCFRDLIHNIYIYTCHVIVAVLCLLPVKRSLLPLS